MKLFIKLFQNLSILMVLVIVFFNALNAFAQDFYQSSMKKYGLGTIEFSAGPAYCFGDAFGLPFGKSVLNGNNYDLSVGFRHIFKKKLGYRVKFQYGNYANKDGVERQHGAGTYNSTTKLLELTARGEYIVRFGPKRRYPPSPDFVYFFGGGGAMKGNIYYPADGYNGFPDFYAGVILSGFGYTHYFNEYFSLGLEITAQYALTDKVDGYPLVVKQNSKPQNDVLESFSVTFGCRIF